MQYYYKALVKGILHNTGPLKQRFDTDATLFSKIPQDGSHGVKAGGKGDSGPDMYLNLCS